MVECSNCTKVVMGSNLVTHTMAPASSKGSLDIQANYRV